MKKIFQEIVELLKKHKLTIASCESFTGGMFANEITNIPGASEVFIGSFVSYSNEFKINIVKVNKRVIKKYGAISQECSQEMVFKTNKLTKAQLVVSFTGNAGPTISEDKEMGTAYISILYLGYLQSFLFEKPNLNRIQFKQAAINFAAKEILNLLQN